jgi:hypothetical protein
MKGIDKSSVGDAYQSDRFEELHGWLSDEVLGGGEKIGLSLSKQAIQNLKVDSYIDYT